MKLSVNFRNILFVLFAIILVMMGIQIFQWVKEYRLLNQMIERLSADSRAAEVLVTKSELDESTRKIKTTIKFLEFNAKGEPLPAKYFTFQGNIIQFQSLVIRFEDKFIKAGDRLRGKSAYLFLKAFVLDGNQTQEFEITPMQGIPAGYKVPSAKSEFEEMLWQEFWNYALNPAKRAQAGIKNAQIEAPGTMFLPGTIYTLKIEHDGGLRIDSKAIPQILQGEKL